MLRYNDNPAMIEQAAYLEGLSAGLRLNGNGQQLVEGAAASLRKLARDVCGKGYICRGGPECQGDHK